ncbi:hypothetical protein EYF80_060056 [Liparis tanakae]|uniref:Uncharacterized protein n=1 Tax=Liparis tanakae TaxID=230148 RepID=A0A4Z2EMU7_9TELE|nr:hypothetical protein EYF80_060056 [Liparis tanakae]
MAAERSDGGRETGRERPSIPINPPASERSFTVPRRGTASDLPPLISRGSRHFADTSNPTAAARPPSLRRLAEVTTPEGHEPPRRTARVDFSSGRAPLSGSPMWFHLDRQGLRLRSADGLSGYRAEAVRGRPR